MEQSTLTMETDFNHLIKDLLTADSIATMESIFAAWQELMSRYCCAIMEAETKFKVLNDRFSLQHERNPIENIKTRITCAFLRPKEETYCRRADTILLTTKRPLDIGSFFFIKMYAVERHIKMGYTL